MEAGEVQKRIWAVAELIDGLPVAPVACHRADELAAAFAALPEAGDPESRQRLEERIWSIWCDHADPAARTALARALHDISARRLEAAQAKLDALVAAHREWAEAWNKRATLFFLRERDGESVDDIERTLHLEPRHFGALGGFAQIALRNGAPDAAVVALERILLVNHSAPGVRETIAAVRAANPRSLH